MTDQTLLIGVGTRLYRSGDGRQMIEAQTVSGLKGWKRSFERVVCYAIESDRPVPEGWIDAACNGIVGPEFKIVPLPDTYRLSSRSKEFRDVRERLLLEMREADYCVFSYGGWLGDPGEIAASVARANGIAHAVWLDRVESQVIRTSGSARAKWKARIKAEITRFNENRAVRKASLALLHGATVYQHFEKIARNPHVADNIHYSEGDRIGGEELAAKTRSCREDVLRIVYVGRAEPMKGGKHWLEVLARLKAKGVTFQASWFGDGSELSGMVAAARSMDLSETEVHFAGFVADRDIVKAAYRNAHVMLFCHLTDESPRNLIESLHAATPLIGYEDPFGRSLIAEHSAGILIERGKVEKLAEAISLLADDRDRLADLVERAARSASHLTHERVFDERSAILKRELHRNANPN